MSATGYPRLNVAGTSASLQSGLSVLSPRILWSLGEVAIAYCREVNEPCSLFIHPAAKQIAGTSDVGVAPYLDGIGGGYANRIELSPDSLGLISKWSIVYASGMPDLSDRFHAANKTTLARVVDFLANAFPNHFIVVSQGLNKVFCVDIDDGSGPTIIPDIGSWGAIHLYELEGKNTNRLTFE